MPGIGAFLSNRRDPSHWLHQCSTCNLGGGDSPVLAYLSPSCQSARAVCVGRTYRYSLNRRASSTRMRVGRVQTMFHSSTFCAVDTAQHPHQFRSRRGILSTLPRQAPVPREGLKAYHWSKSSGLRQTVSKVGPPAAAVVEQLVAEEVGKPRVAARIQSRFVAEDSLVAINDLRGIANLMPAGTSCCKSP